MSEVIQERLFDTPDDPIVEGRGLMFGFIAEETAELDLSDEHDCVTAIDIILIAAEYHAQTLAAVRGDVDPDNEAFLSDTLMGRVNAPDCLEVFELDVDKIWCDVDRADTAVILWMEERAFAIAQTLIDDQRLAGAMK